MATSWRFLINDALVEHGETWTDVEYNTLSERGLDREFDEECPNGSGEPFTMWTKERVYFPVIQSRSGFTRVESVPRNPNYELTSHIGD